MPNFADNIVAISTPIAQGAISIVRISGADALAVALTLTHRANLTPRMATLCDIFNAKNELLDQAIVIFFAAPRSYTAENLVEIQCHGGLLIARQIVEAALALNGAVLRNLNAGFARVDFMDSKNADFADFIETKSTDSTNAQTLNIRLATPGEFTKRALINGRIDLSQAEAIAKLITSKSASANKILLSHMKGALGKIIEQAADSIINLIACAEASIDYAEELESDLTEQMAQKLEELIAQFGRIYEDSKRRQSAIEGHRLAIIGKPNVGKSSILNALLSFERAIVSDIAGTTRDTIEEVITISGSALKIIDTAGIRATDNAIESVGIERSIAAFNECDIALALFDASAALDKQDIEILRMLESAKDKRIIIALNKSDLAQESTESDIFAILPHLNFAQNDSANFAFGKESSNDSACFGKESAQDSKNFIIHTNKSDISALQNALEAIVKDDEVGEGVVLISLHQLNCVSEAITALKLARQSLTQGAIELFSLNLTTAAKALSSITKPYNTESILDAMFSTFCLGK